MSPRGLSSSRSPWVQLEHGSFRLIAYGDERDDNGNDPFSLPCHVCGAKPHQLHFQDCPMGHGSLYQRPTYCRDCGCRIGNLHVLNCGVEQCPRCGYQYASCDCNGSEDSEHEIAPEE
jgi:hypothetical protein